MAIRRVMVVAATTAYQTPDLVRAAEELGIELVLATDRCRVLAELWPEGAVPLSFRDEQRAVAAIVAEAHSRPIAGLVPTDEVTAVIAARAAADLGLPHNPPGATAAAADKLAFRTALRAAGLPTPTRFQAVPVDADPASLAAGLTYPVVMKPLGLSASRGVMRADDPASFCARFERLVRLVRAPDIDAEQVLVESYLPGEEIAVEGVLRAGELTVLAVFDKPDPLEGPTFAETIYVTPSSHPAPVQDAATDAVSAAARALGLCEGPVHAELRLTAGGPVVLELAARPIGGLCGRAVRFRSGLGLEHVLLSHAVGDGVDASPDPGASGVLMIPVPIPGVLEGVDGQEQVAAMPGVDEVVITAPLGDVVVPLPEGSAYLGFVFARGDAPGQVVEVLRGARAHLQPRIKRRLNEQLEPLNE